MSERDIPQPIGDDFDAESPASDGYIALPPSMQLSDRTRIYTMFPGDQSFISPGSAQIDERSHRVSLDTGDKMLAVPRTLKELRERPAVMRVLRGIGKRATRVLDGYVMDFRWVKTVIYDDRGLDEGVGSAEFMEAQENYKTVLPLGVIFLDDNKTLYVGSPDVRNEALQLAAWVDEAARTLGAWPDDQPKPRRAAINEWPNVND